MNHGNALAGRQTRDFLPRSEGRADLFFAALYSTACAVAPSLMRGWHRGSVLLAVDIERERDMDRLVADGPVVRAARPRPRRACGDARPDRSRATKIRTHREPAGHSISFTV